MESLRLLRLLCSGMECTIFMGEIDVKRQELNVFRMELLGCEGS